ncbi:trigger factor [Selenomonas sp. TAMA-11512]|uniref:trigger factor n=1 Tax=Selenomonas sp. TAMA-11512 TaxID=3095337 RepID=UPI00308BCC3E|nr:trigger factor [Selenomonas sp. TAMA-11512]
MKVTKEQIENKQVVLTIEVEAAELKKAMDAAFKHQAGHVNIPGFRKGKAPKKLVEQHVGKDAILQEAFDRVAQPAFAEALDKEDVQPVTRPKIEVVTLEEGKDVVFKATVTPKPEVKLGEYKGLKIEKKIDAVTDEDVDKQINNMLNRQAKMVDAPEGASVKDGDFITLDFKGFVDGEAFAGGESKDYPLQIGSKSFIPGFEDQLIGAKIGEERDVNVKFPDEYHSKELAGKDAKFECVVRSIKEKQLPELDDEFAKKASTFQTLDELKTDIRKNLEETAERKAEQDQQMAALEQATQNMEVEIPDVMIEDRISMMLQEMSMRMQQQGLNFQDYLQHSGADITKIREDYRETATANVRTDLLLDAVAKAEDIKVEPEDLDAEVAGMAAAYGATVKEVQKIIREQGRIGDLATTVLRKKTVKLITDSIAE